MGYTNSYFYPSENNLQHTADSRFVPSKLDLKPPIISEVLKWLSSGHSDKLLGETALLNKFFRESVLSFFTAT
jgi:hypothetical protein